jgi:hypothetical protein
MLKLEIKNADGSHYWTEHFNDLASAEKWYAEEQTRNYWKADRVAQFIDKTPPPPSKEEKDKEKAKEEDSRNRKSLLKMLAQKEDLTVAELKQAVELILREKFI